MLKFLLTGPRFEVLWKFEQKKDTIMSRLRRRLFNIPNPFARLLKGGISGYVLLFTLWVLVLLCWWMANFELMHTQQEQSKRLQNIAHRLVEPFREKRVDCDGVIRGDPKATKFATSAALALKSKEDTVDSNDETYITKTACCSEFIYQRGYITSALSQEEEDFPIAYSIVVFKDVEMVERLLRSIYQPQNIYCLHVDSKSTQNFHNAILSIARCFSNVHVLNERINVTWGNFSVLQADLMCMEFLWKYPQWKYLINLTGQEFPLKTNLQLVRILKALRGANDIHGNMEEGIQDHLFDDIEPPPYQIRPVKGAVHIAASRGFIDFALHDPRAKALLQWVKKVRRMHDEAFFSTLNFNKILPVPGSYRGIHYEHPEIKSYLGRYKVWYPAWQFCANSYYPNDICILSTGDLPLLAKSRKLFANKFHLWDDRLVIGCLEELLSNRTLQGVTGELVMDDYYNHLEFVEHQFVPGVEPS